MTPAGWINRAESSSSGPSHQAAGCNSAAGLRAWMA
jgi:hypothetical protein